MKEALIIGASGGIGSAVCLDLRGRGYGVTAISRRDDGLDITDPASVARCLAPLEGPFEVIFVATGALKGAGAAPEKSLKALTAAAMLDQFQINCVGPALILQHVARLLPRRGPAFCGVLSARVGSISDNALGGWYSYRAAKAALNQTVHGVAIEIARTHPNAVLACLHPGTVDTAFTEGFERQKLTPEQSAAALMDVLLNLESSQSGTFWDWTGAQVPW